MLWWLYLYTLQIPATNLFESVANQAIAGGRCRPLGRAGRGDNQDRRKETT